MKLSVSDLRTERRWRATIGMDQPRFEQLLALFSQSYYEKYGQTVSQRQGELEVTASLQSEQELLLFTLFSLKSGLSYDVLGVVCGMDGANAKRNQVLGLEVLEQALSSAGCLPVREFKDAAAFAQYLKNEKTLIFDGTEQRVQRPSNQKAQKAHYSGKKKATR
jgi:hypothetical protein